jgi:hypothetical protein
LQPSVCWCCDNRHWQDSSGNGVRSGRNLIRERNEWWEWIHYFFWSAKCEFIFKLFSRHSEMSPYKFHSHNQHRKHSYTLPDF